MLSKSIEKLANEFNKLPGIGKKSALRLAFHILEMDNEDVIKFTKIMLDVKENVKRCSICGNISEEENCVICENEERDNETICVVEDVRDVIAMEKSGMYKGHYHVLHGKISPLNGVEASDLNIDSLIERINKSNIKEVILALNPDLEGEMTSLYLSKILKENDVQVTKIASGIPMGGNIEYADMATIISAIENRKKF